MPEWKGRVPLTRSHCERITVAVLVPNRPLELSGGERTPARARGRSRRKGSGAGTAGASASVVKARSDGRARDNTPSVHGRDGPIFAAGCLRGSLI
ncbi:hypothetical protein EVAR_46306_1 [Eumeta japonica]|uniref:Uncharacterized protein n=1 Tax=Eumeta variegata TaxID=151549 RepID=A0A4C1XYB3_EUMVA|nr:hypothetical protein EVAR_46306_1 [Eumeta japonica]